MATRDEKGYIRYSPEELNRIPSFEERSNGRAGLTNTVLGGLAGGLVGSAAGPAGALAGTAAGAVVGNQASRAGGTAGSTGAAGDAGTGFGTTAAPGPAPGGISPGEAGRARLEGLAGEVQEDEALRKYGPRT